MSEKVREKDAFLETFLETSEEVKIKGRKLEDGGTLSTNSRRFKTLTVYFCMFCHVRIYNFIHFSRNKRKVASRVNHIYNKEKYVSK